MAKHMQSPRLMALAGLAEGSALLWDVGSDHGKLPAWLLMNGKIEYAVASDIRQGPLESAMRTAKACKVEDRMKFLLCDGLNAPAEDMSYAAGADTVVVAGMGGETIAAILGPAEWVREKGVRLLLQPMSSAEDLREHLYSGHYTVNAEYLIPDSDKPYLIIDAKGGGCPETYDLADTRIGKHLNKDGLFQRYAEREIRRMNKELSGMLPRESERADHESDLTSGLLPECLKEKAAEIKKAICKIEAAKGESINANCSRNI